MSGLKNQMKELTQLDPIISWLVTWSTRVIQSKPITTPINVSKKKLKTIFFLVFFKKEIFLVNSSWPFWPDLRSLFWVEPNNYGINIKKKKKQTRQKHRPITRLIQNNGPPFFFSLWNRLRWHIVFECGRHVI